MSKEVILDLQKYKGQGVRIKFIGGREITGVLKGFDQLLNIVLEDASEYLRNAEDPDSITTETRKIGIVVCRGVSIMSINPIVGMKEIENPFAAVKEGDI
ncbi:hypothetical protein WA158_001799 [Blastocystis sp. Blastoise]